MQAVHIKKLDVCRIVLQIQSMAGDEYPFKEEGRRLRWLRQAHRIDTTVAFAQLTGWGQSGVSMFETGKRQLTTPKMRQLSSMFPGFDPQYLWTGEKRGLSFDLLQRIQAEEAKELGIAPQSSSRER